MSTKDAQVQIGTLNRKKLGDVIRAKRKQEGLSLDALAKVVGISKPTLSRLERALYWPNTQNLLAICRWLKQSPESFSYGAPKKFSDRNAAARLTLTHYTTPANAGQPKLVFEEGGEERDLVAALMPSAGEYFSIPVSGDSMIEASIKDGDLLIVRRSESARPGDIVVANTSNGTLVKEYVILRDGSEVLRSANPNPEYTDVPFANKRDGNEIRGIVIHSIHQHKRRL